jgi:hypothetical protein
VNGHNGGNGSRLLTPGFSKLKAPTQVTVKKQDTLDQDQVTMPLETPKLK